MMGLEPTTFCMASRRSSQLSYIRGTRVSIAAPSRGRTRLAAARRPPRAHVSESSASFTSRSASSLCSRRTAV
jgi:hypothetical protein